MSSYWRKNPSVTRAGKSFYRRADGVTVLQSWLSGLWAASNAPKIEHKTARAAMRAVDAASPYPSTPTL